MLIPKQTLPPQLGSQLPKHKGIYELILDSVVSKIIKTKPNVKLIPSHINLVGAEIEPLIKIKENSCLKNT